MEKFVVYEEDFYQSYSKFELWKFRKRLDKMQKLLDKEDLEGALNCVMERPYINVKEFAFYRINLLIRLNRIDEALDIANDEQFKTFRPIQTQREGIINYLEKIKQEEQKRLEEEKLKQEEHKRLEEERLKQEEEKKRKEELELHRRMREEDRIKRERSAIEPESYQPKDKKRDVIILLTKIYVGVITLEEIKNAEIDEYTKVILSACYYDKFNHAAGTKYLKSVRNNYDGEERKTLNKLIARLEDKRNRFFDMGIYSSLLGVYVDNSYAIRLQEGVDAEKQLENNKKNAFNRQIEEEARIRREKLHKEKSELKAGINQTNDTNNNVVVGKNTVPGYVTEQPKELTEESLETQEEYNMSSTIESSSKPESDIITTTLTSVGSKKKINKTIREIFPTEAEAISTYFYDLADKSKEYVKKYNDFEKLIDTKVDKAQALKEFEKIVQTLAKNRDVRVEYEAKKFLDLKKRQ